MDVDGPDIAAGTRIGNVVVEQELGSGAYGVVYRGRDTLLDRPVALKVLKSRGLFENVAERRRFLAEAKVIASLASPHVVTLYHLHPFGDDGWALELELVDGGTLADLLGEDLRLPSETVVRIGREVGAALGVAHERGVVHGDVKPENVLFDRTGAAKLTDFGLARVIGDRELHRSSSGGALGGTPYYMAPEVILGEGNVPASDLWSLGVVLYRMLSGRLPFTGQNLFALFFAIQNQTPPPLGPEVPPGLASLVERCLRKKPSERPASAVALREALSTALASAPATRTRPTRVEPPASRLLGRDAELGALTGALRSAAEGQGRAVLLTGEAGMGKTTLVRALEATARAEGFRWIACTLTGSAGLLRPLFEAVRWSLAPDGGDPVAALPADRFGTAVPLLARLVRDASAPEEESRQRVAWALRRLVEGLASEVPLVLVFDGVEHAEPSEANLVRDLARAAGRTRLLVLAVARTSGTSAETSGPLAPLAELDDVVRVSLGPLSAERLYALVESALDVRLSPEVTDRVVERSEGNPLFALELLGHLRTTRAVTFEGRDVVPGPTWKTESLPGRLVDLLSGRLRKLPQALRDVLDVAAVDGLEFDGEAIAAVLHKDLLGVLRALQNLARDQGMVVPQARGYRFAHSLLRRVLYGEVAPELRRALHRSLALHLEARSGPVDAERLAAHWEGAGEEARARPYLRAAADRAIERNEIVRALDLGARGGLVLGQVDRASARESWELLMKLARALTTVGGRVGDVEATYETLLDVAREDRDTLRQMRVIARRAHTRYFDRNWKPSDEEDLRRAASLLPVSSDLGRAQYLLGVIAKFRGELDEATRWLRLADGTFRAGEGSELFRSNVLDQLASVALRSARLDDAERLYGEAAEVSAAAGQAANASASRVNAVLVGLSRGALEGQVDALSRAIRTLRLEHASRLAAQATVVLAQVHVAHGDFPAAFAALHQARALPGSATHLPTVGAAETELGYLHGIAGRYGEAGACLDRALAAVESQGDVDAQGLVWAYRSLLARYAGGEGAARDAGRRCVTLLRSHPERPSTALALVALYEGTLHAAEPRDLSEALGEWTDGSEAPATATIDAARAWRRSLLAEPESEADLAGRARVAELLRGDGIAFRRCVLRVVGAVLHADGLAARGDVSSALEEAVGARREAGRLGHMPLHDVCGRRVAAWCPDPERRRDLLADSARVGPTG